MKKRSRAPKRVRGADRFAARREWIGGRLSPPFFIHDRKEPYRPEMVVWMELPSELVVANEVFDPADAEGMVARGLLAAMEHPLAGPPRRPDTIRVADASLAAEVQAAVGSAIPVVVAPTPELDDLLGLMIDSMPGPEEDESYLEGGRIAPAKVKALFAAAQILYRMAPWKVATDAQVLRMDIPALDVDGACVSIIGHLGHSRGVMVFPSHSAYEAFLRVAEGPLPRRGLVDFGTGWLALSFDRGADLPPSMRREVLAHAWPVAGDDAYPRVERRDSDGASRPLVDRDLKIAAVCAMSLSTFFIKHRSRFEVDEFEPVCESYFDEDDLEVRFTLPYEAFPFFEVDEAPAFRTAPPAGAERPKVGRNAPCPCGSGRKYKKCHLPLDTQERPARDGIDAHHDLDAHLVHELTNFAEMRFGHEWRRFEKDFADVSEAVQLALPWSVYGYEVQGATVLEWYLEERGQRLSHEDRAWLAGQQASWLSIWEVLEVEPGAGVTLHDLLSDEKRHVREDGASRGLVVRDAMLGRVVDCDGVSLLCGVHPRPLPPLDAAEVVRRARGRLRRKRAVPVDRLRDTAIGRYLIRRWEEAVARVDERSAIPPDLRNTDGDALLLTIDHFEIASGAGPTVEARLAALKDVQRPEAGDDPPIYVFLRPGDKRRAIREDTLIGRALFSDTALQLETNSRERADMLRKRVEAACGDRIRHRIREHTDPLSSKAKRASSESAPELSSPEVQQVLLEFKQRHYADWIDHALPALGGATPREAARTAKGLAGVDTLLKDMENHERRGAGGAAFDFSGIRRELGLE